MRSKIAKVKVWMKENRHSLRLRSLWLLFTAKLAGHARYFGVSFNSANVSKCRRLDERAAANGETTRHGHRVVISDRADDSASSEVLPGSPNRESYPGVRN